MFKCRSCNESFTYKEIFKHQFSFSNLICDKCSQEYVLKSSYKNIGCVLVSLPLLVKNKLANEFGGYALLVLLIWYSIIFITMPFFNKYKNINESGLKQLHNTE